VPRRLERSVVSYAQVDEFHEGILSSFRRNRQEKNGRSVFSEENLRISMGHQISQRCRRDTVGILENLKAQEGQYR
jgi:hypothetical protein